MQYDQRSTRSPQLVLTLALELRFMSLSPTWNIEFPWRGQGECLTHDENQIGFGSIAGQWWAGSSSLFIQPLGPKHSDGASVYQATSFSL